MCRDPFVAVGCGKGNHLESPVRRLLARPFDAWIQVGRVIHTEAPDDTAHRAAVRIQQDRTMAPDLLQARCALGLEEIFGD